MQIGIAIGRSESPLVQPVAWLFSSPVESEGFTMLANCIFPSIVFPSIVLPNCIFVNLVFGT